MIHTIARYRPEALDPAIVDLLVNVIDLAHDDSAGGHEGAAAWLAHLQGREAPAPAPRPARLEVMSVSQRPAPARPWPLWASIVLCYIADGWAGAAAMRALGRNDRMLFNLASQRPDFAAALAEARAKATAREPKIATAAD